MCAFVDDVPENQRSVDCRRVRRRWIRVGLQLVILQIALPFLFFHSARAEDPAEPGDDGFAGRRAVADRITELENQAFNPSLDGGLTQCVAAMQAAADLAKSTFGEGHWLSRLKQSLANGLKSITELPTAQQELFQDTLAAQLTGYRLAREGKRDLTLKQYQRAHEKCVAAIGADHVIAAYSLFGIASDESTFKAPDLAKRHALLILPVAEKHWGKDSPARAHALRILGNAEGQLHEFESAEGHLREAIRIFEPVVAEGLSDFYVRMYAAAHCDLARALNEQGRYAEAELPARRAAELLGLYAPAAYVEMVLGLLEVARSESGRGRYSQAETTFVAVRRNLPKLHNPALTAYFAALYDDHRAREGRRETAGGKSELQR